MKISVVISTLNEEANVVNAIQSAWNAGADEVVVADGGSNDRTCEFAQSKNCIVVNSRRGRGTQLNSGAKVATGDVLLFLHADNFLREDLCEQIRKRFHHPFVFGAFGQRIQNKKMIYRLVEFGNWLRAKYRRLPYGDQGIFVSREAFESVDGFIDEPLMEDVALANRLAKTYRPLILPGPILVSARRWEKNGVLRQTWFNWRLLARYRKGESTKILADEYDSQATND